MVVIIIIVIITSALFPQGGNLIFLRTDYATCVRFTNNKTENKLEITELYTTTGFLTYSSSLAQYCCRRKSCTAVESMPIFTRCVCGFTIHARISYLSTVVLGEIHRRGLRLGAQKDVKSGASGFRKKKTSPIVYERFVNLHDFIGNICFRNKETFSKNTIL